MPRAEFETLYRQHAGALRRFLTGMLRSHEDAEDVAQEALMRLWRLSDWSVVGQPRTLLFTIAYRIAIDRIRRRKLERGLFDDGTAVTQAAAEEPSCERTVIARQTLQAVVIAMNGLKPLRRKILLRNRMDGQSYGQIARETGLSTDAIQKHVARALRACALDRAA
ncbi:MAG: RNA polymerase sigma factor [Proteobacteria bacterium]|nr:RNA polymerase sigma factor [Pseudomonadota bacterium]